MRAAYQYGPTDPGLNRACCDWLGSKLEPGPTLTAYQNLADDVKANWDRLEMELAKLYCNEEEKQMLILGK